jgi:deazaflavin-dependent oxidoreductase (nitroreductase family)
MPLAMPMPLWWGKINKRVFNPRAVRSGRWEVLTHVGRVSGRTHKTPLDAHEVDGKYLFVLVYGSGTDWVKNVLAAGGAELETGEEIVSLTDPRVVTGDDGRRLLEGVAKPPPRILAIDEFLLTDIAGRRPA